MLLLRLTFAWWEHLEADRWAHRLGSQVVLSGGATAAVTSGKLGLIFRLEGEPIGRNHASWLNHSDLLVSTRRLHALQLFTNNVPMHLISRVGQLNGVALRRLSDLKYVIGARRRLRCLHLLLVSTRHRVRQTAILQEYVLADLVSAVLEAIAIIGKLTWTAALHTRLHLA